MIKYYSWAIAEKVLSYVPYGDKIYYGLGRKLERNRKGRSGPMQSALNLVQEGLSLIKENDSILDVGTGWYHHEPFLFYLAGNYKIYLFDVMDKAEINYIKNYLIGISERLSEICCFLNIPLDYSRSKLNNILCLDNKTEIYEACDFHPIITQKTNSLFLPANSIDLMISNCVINHIPLSILKPELIVLKRILKSTGKMHFLIGHDDHWAFRDHSANMFQYYKYSDSYYKLIFETDFQFQNRLVKNELEKLFAESGLKVFKYFPHQTDLSLSEIRKLRNVVNKRFSNSPDEELSVIHSYFTLGK